MNFENVIKRISSIAATAIIFIVAVGIYLGAKGFVVDEDGNIKLQKEARAEVPAVTTEISKNTKIDYSKKPILGKADAPVTIYEFSSFACGHCADFHTYTLPKVKEDFIDKGLVKVIFVDFPLDKKSMQASVLSYCLEGDNYFEFLNIVFKNQKEWSFSFNSEKVFSKYASLFDLNQKQINECLKNKDLESEILEIRKQAIDKYKITGTPTFVIEYKGEEEIINGAPNYSGLKELINKKLGIKG